MDRQPPKVTKEDLAGYTDEELSSLYWDIYTRIGRHQMKKYWWLIPVKVLWSCFFRVGCVMFLVLLFILAGVAYG